MVSGTPWTGFYVNGGIGYGMWAADTTNRRPARALHLLRDASRRRQGLAGNDWRRLRLSVLRKIVAGVFGDASVSSLKARSKIGYPLAGDIKQDIVLGGRRPRGLAGHTEDPQLCERWLHRRAFLRDDHGPAFTGRTRGLTTPAATTNGWFLGGGVETSVAPNWFWRTEYRYAYYGSKTLTEADDCRPLSTSPSNPPFRR